MDSSLLVDRDNRQKAVIQWVEDTFGKSSLTTRERALRVLEEAIELAQAEGIEINQACSVAEHVFSKPPGDPVQEVGGLGVTLLAYCEARGVSADMEERREFNRVLAVDPAHFRARHNKKADASIAARAPEEPKR